MEHPQTQTFGPYSPVRQAGNLYFVSGQVGVDPATKQAADDVRQQASQALENLRNTLADANLTPDDVVKTTIFLVNMDDFAAVNEVYQEFFAAPRPARSTVGVAELPRVAGDTPIKVEIEAIASSAAPGQET